MRKLRLLALLLIPPGFAVPIVAILRSRPDQMSGATVAAYVGGSLLIIGGYAALVLATLPRQGGKDDEP